MLVGVAVVGAGVEVVVEEVDDAVVVVEGMNPDDVVADVIVYTRVIQSWV